MKNKKFKKLVTKKKKNKTIGFLYLNFFLK